MILEKSRILASLIGLVSTVCICEVSVSMNDQINSLIDLSALNGHAVVPRPKIVPVPADLGHEDLLLQNILMRAISVAIGKEIEGGRTLNVNTLLNQRIGGWNDVKQANFPAVLTSLREIEANHNMVYNLNKAAFHHAIGSSTAATLFAHITKQRHIWNSSNALAGNALDLHYLSWGTSIRVFDAGPAGIIPNAHSSFVIPQNVEPLSFFKALLDKTSKAVDNNINNITVTRPNANTIFVDITGVENPDIAPIALAYCNPSQVATLVPPPGGGGAGGLARLRALLSAGGANNQLKANSIRNIADTIGQAGAGVIVTNHTFPTTENGQRALVSAPLATNRIRICINTVGAPYIASMYPIIN